MSDTYLPLISFFALTIDAILAVIVVVLSLIAM